jgi:hypothetical protein
MTPLFKEMIEIHARNAEELDWELEKFGERADQSGSFMSTEAAYALHGKGDHKAGLEQSEKAVKLSDSAHTAGFPANDKSKAAAH